MAKLCKKTLPGSSPICKITAFLKFKILLLKG